MSDSFQSESDQIRVGSGQILSGSVELRVSEDVSLLSNPSVIEFVYLFVKRSVALTFLSHYRF